MIQSDRILKQHIIIRNLMKALKKEQKRLDFALKSHIHIKNCGVCDTSDGLIVLTHGHKNNRDAIDAAMEILNG